MFPKWQIWAAFFEWMLTGCVKDASSHSSQCVSNCKKRKQIKVLPCFSRDLALAVGKRFLCFLSRDNIKGLTADDCLSEKVSKRLAGDNPVQRGSTCGAGLGTVPAGCCVTPSPQTSRLSGSSSRSSSGRCGRSASTQGTKQGLKVFRWH